MIGVQIKCLIKWECVRKLAFVCTLTKVVSVTVVSVNSYSLVMDSYNWRVMADYSNMTDGSRKKERPKLLFDSL